MSVRDLTLGQLDVVFHAWLGEERRGDFERDGRLAPWRGAVAEALERVRTTSAGAAPELEARPPSGPSAVELDRAVEAAIRTLAWAMTAAEQAARASGDAARAERLVKAFAFVFDRGLRFLAVPMPEQVGETRRLVTLARTPNVEALMEGTTIAGSGWGELVARVEAGNAALDAALTQEAPAKDAGPSARTVRTQGVRLANLVAQTAEAVLGKDDAERFLSVFRREVARAAARRAGSGGVAPADGGGEGPDDVLDVTPTDIG